jgi:pyruvyl transferase EpsO
MSGLIPSSSSEFSRSFRTGSPNSSEPTKKNRAEATIERLQREIDRVLGPEIAGVHALALVDFPDYTNVGDSAIYLGAVEWLQDHHGLVPGYVCNWGNFSARALQRAVPEGPILITGGGNFGDIWPRHQQFRETVMAAFPDRRIIQLPQSIHFDDLAARDRAARKIAAHGNFLLLVRDQKSFDLANKAFDCEVRLCPDMALALGPQPRPLEARNELFLLVRTDKERAGQAPCQGLPAGAVITDWLDEPDELRKWIRRWSVCRTALAAPARSLDRNYQCERYYRTMAAHRVARGLRMLASGHTVITDRLHSHILCLLLQIPHIVFDNNYGKLDSFIQTWTADCGLVERAGGLIQALDSWNRREEAA